MSVSSAQGGRILTPKKWSSHNKGYLYGTDCSNYEKYRLAREYIKEKGFCDDSKFDHTLDCFYLENNCHIEKRGGHRYLRPSLCAKMVFKNSVSVFNDTSWLYSYHGTQIKNVKSILTNGLTYPGYSKRIQIKANHGSRYGPGVYTSKLPLYAQLYAECDQWRGKYVQVILMVRQKPSSITQCGSEGCYTANMIGRTDIHQLYGGGISSDEVQFVTTVVEQNNIIQAMLIKIHDQKPDKPGGEYHDIARILDSIKSN